MKQIKYLGIAMCFSFIFATLGVKAWSVQGIQIYFGNWGTQTKYTSYEDKETLASQSWETLGISNGGNLEVVLQGDTMGTITDGPRIYLSEGATYTWKTGLSQVTSEDYRLKFIKNGWTIGATNLTGFWYKY